MLPYHVGTSIKICIGLGILCGLYFTIDPRQDPAIALGLGFVGVFLASWGLSFYLFYAVERRVRGRDALVSASDSYKLSLLFGIFCLINLALILLGYWSKVLGTILLAGFVGLQVLLSLPARSHGHQLSFQSVDTEPEREQ